MYNANDIIKVWMTQMTADKSVRCEPELRMDLIKSFRNYAHLELAFANPADTEGLKSFITRCEQALKNGHGNDIEIKGANKALFSRIQDHCNRELSGSEWIYDIGGSPGISAIAGMSLDGDFGNTYFVGNRVKSALEVLDIRYHKYGNRFRGKATIHQPTTFSFEHFEGKNKYMVPFSEGREMKDLERPEFFEELDCLLRQRPAVVALGGLNKGEPGDYLDIIGFARRRKAKVFVGTNSFKSSADALRNYEELLSGSDIVSYNDTELKSVYIAKGGQKDVSLPTMLRDIGSMDGAKITVCHFEAGALAYGGPKEELREALEMAGLGASFRYETGRYGSHSDLLEYKMGGDRADKRFLEIVGRPVEDLDARIAGVVARDLSKTRIAGSITGAGATFDGILLSYVAHLLWR